MWVTVVHLVAHRPRDQMRNNCVSIKLILHPLMGCNRKWGGFCRAGGQGTGFCSQREESCRCHWKDKRGKVVTEERSLGPFSSSMAPRFLFSLSFAKSINLSQNAFPNRLEKEVWNYGGANASCKPAVWERLRLYCLAGPWLTQEVRWEERVRRKVGRFDKMLKMGNWV